MTEAEIKKDLLFVAHYCHDEYNEIRVDVLLLNALDLINRQQEMIDAFIAGQETLQKALAEKIAEIERLQKENNQFADIGKMYSEIKSEAVKEFAERLKERKKYNTMDSIICTNEMIDNLVAEMVGKS